MVLTDKIAKIFVASGLLLFLSFMKFGLVCGSRGFFFSGFIILAPLLGAFLGLRGVGFAFLGVKLLRYLMLGSLSCVTMGFPTLAAAWCWSLDFGSEHRPGVRFLVNTVLPLACLFLFVLHPDVGHGFWYGLYWIIPVGIYVFQAFGFLRNTVFFTALKSSFIAHAVGSVLWCYMVPMTPHAWLMLIPVVAVERLVIACGMALLYRVVVASKKSKSEKNSNIDGVASSLF